MWSGQSALDAAWGESDVIYILLKNGAELKRPTFGYHASGLNLAKALAKLQFESNSLGTKKLEYLQSKGNRETFVPYKDCLNELNRMKNHQLYNDLTMYDIFKLREHPDKLMGLLKNQDFADALKSPRNTKRYRNYSSDLDSIINKAFEKIEILESQKKKMHESGLCKEFSLPSEIVEIIAYYANEDLL